VQVWNHRAEDLWGLRGDEAADHHFLSLDIGLPSEQLAPALRAVLTGASERETSTLQAVNRRGRAILCVATVLPLVNASADGHRVTGAIVLMEDNAADGAQPAA
jgi:two-component system CheB/CheR fusion protein